MLYLNICCSVCEILPCNYYLALEGGGDPTWKQSTVQHDMKCANFCVVDNVVYGYSRQKQQDMACGDSVNKCLKGEYMTNIIIFKKKSFFSVQQVSILLN